MGEKSISPRPSSFSAPLESRMVRESTLRGNSEAGQEGIFALMTPVMTSTDGRWVADDKVHSGSVPSGASRQIEIFDFTWGCHHQVSWLIDDNNDLRH